MPDSIPTSVIADAQLADYRDKGFTVVADIFTADEVAAMRAVIDELIAGAAGLTTHDEIYDLEPSHTPERPRVRRIKAPFKVHPIFDRMVRHPRLIAALTRLIGPDLRLFGGKLNMKAAGYGSPVEWHQDWAFYPHTNDDVLAVGVMLDDMTPDNGPLLIVPGSHNGPVHDHHQDDHFVGAIDPNACDCDFESAEMVLGSAGSCSFHHVRAVHGSAVNTSGADRRLLLYEVTAADAWPLLGMREANWEAHRASILAGAPCTTPRLTGVAVRLPLPEPLRQGSIYETQTSVRNTWFR
ncbi:MAG: phytanoyl-CoA dioxygenase family protein [Alphaproteobacteria bacterium]